MNPPIFAFTVELPTTLHVEGYESSNPNVIGCDFKVLHDGKEVKTIDYAHRNIQNDFVRKGVYQVIPTSGNLEALREFNFYIKTSELACR